MRQKCIWRHHGNGASNGEENNVIMSLRPWWIATALISATMAPFMLGETPQPELRTFLRDKLAFSASDLCI
jgi:hypothetical protein